MPPENTSNQNANMNRPTGESSVGGVVATIIVLAVIVLGGLYFWHEHSAQTDTSGQSTIAPSADTMATDTAPTYDQGVEYHGS